MWYDVYTKASNMSLRLIFILLLQLVASGVHANTQDSLVLTHLSITNDLPSDHVYYVYQDRHGYIWIFTDNGIVKYNGYTFKLFNSSTGLPSSDVWNCYEDSYGRKWLGTYGYEVGFIKNDVYNKVAIETKGVATKIRTLNEQAGYVYITASSNVHINEDLYVIDSTNNVVKTFHDITNLTNIIGDSVLMQQAPDIVFYKPTPAGIKSVHRVKDWASIAKANTSTSQFVGYNRIHYKRGGDSLLWLDLKTGQSATKSIREFGAGEMEKIYLIYALNDRFNVITNRKQYILSKEFHLLSAKPYQNILPNHAQLTYHFTDKSNNEWYTTSSKGCYLVYANRNVFAQKHDLNAALANAHKVGQLRDGSSWWYDEVDLQLMAMDSTGNILMRTHIGENVMAVADGPNNSVLVVLIDDIRRITRNATLEPWIDHSKQFYEINTGGINYNKRRELTGVNKNESLKSMSSIHCYSKDKMYSIGFYGLRSIISYQDSMVIKVIDASRYTGLYYDSTSDRYWVYNKGRLGVLNPATDEFKVLDNEILNTLNLFALNGVSGDRFGNIFLQFAHQLIVYNAAIGLYKVIAINASIADAKMAIVNNVILIADVFGVALADVYGPLRVSEFRYTPNVKTQYYNRLHSLCHSARGGLLMHTNKGFFSTDIQKLKSGSGNKSQIWSERMFVQTSASVVRVDVDDTIRVTSETDRISLDYINYLGKGGRMYSYMLNKDREWHQTSSGELFIASVAPGVYEKVYCRVEDNIWKSKHYSFYIYKVPYWYQTSVWHTIFLLAGIVLLVVILLLVILVTRTTIASSNEKKRMQVELELRAIHAQINPHFIFNTLSSALYFINKKKIDEAYNHVSKFSRLLRSYLKASRNRYTVLSEELEILNNYVELQRVRFENKFDYIVEVDKRIPVDSIQIPSLLLQPLVENAINHGLFHRGDGGLLKLKFEQGKSSNELNCYIDDNGIGRERAKELKRESVAEYESYGSKLTEELIDLFRKYEQMDIEVDYIDKQAPETGTIVKLTIRNMRYVA
ncbi:MAG: hypothetical protein EOP56_04015 [Sphingobacteriales bacterium]|nr:MAG: hypothetical protein EOP56_04015 [Sphingobacteriales bacterium]